MNQHTIALSVPDSLAEVLWVGRLATDDDLLVFDGSWQPAMPDKVRLFSVEQNAWRLFLPDLVRRKLRKVTDAALIRAAVDAYSEFAAAERAREAAERLARAHAMAEARAESTAWLAAETERRRERTMALGRQHLGNYGIQDTRYRLRSGRLPARFTHCWACKGPLDSGQDLEHVACGWLVCSCGACGCGRDLA